MRAHPYWPPFKEPEVVDKNGWTGNIHLCYEKVGGQINTLVQPLHWKQPRRIFVNSMSDLFHKDVPFEFIDKVFDVMRRTPDHTYLVFTKRAKTMGDFIYQAYGKTTILTNVQLILSLSTQKEADEKIPILLQIPAAVRGLSLEPLLEGIGLEEYICKGGLAYKILSRHYGKDGFDPKGKQPERTKQTLDWVIVGCESGPKRRPCKIEWVRSIVNQCQAASVPVYVKQLSINCKVSRNMAEWPEDLRIQQYPERRLK